MALVILTDPVYYAYRYNIALQGVLKDPNANQDAAKFIQDEIKVSLIESDKRIIPRSALYKALLNVITNIEIWRFAIINAKDETTKVLDTASELDIEDKLQKVVKSREDALAAIARQQEIIKNAMTNYSAEEEAAIASYFRKLTDTVRAEDAAILVTI